MKTKNAPKGLKCNKPYFFLKQGFPKGGEGGGGPTFGKNSQIIPYFFSDVFPNHKHTGYSFDHNGLSL